MAAFDKLQLYNGALLILGERKLASLTEARKPRYLLDEVWDQGKGAVHACLEMGQWNFGARVQSFSYSPSVTPSFGFTYAFDKPDDFVRTMKVSADDRFSVPMGDGEYRDIGGYWYADVDTIYIEYVSSDSTAGGDYSLWPQNFGKLVQAYLAFEIGEALSASAEKVNKAARLMQTWKGDARTQDAMAQPAKARPLGSWARARGGGSRGDRGSTGSLTG